MTLLETDARPAERARLLTGGSRGEIDSEIGPGRYLAFDGERLSGDAEGATPVSPFADFVHASFRALVLNPRFACVAARSAFNRANYRFSAYENELGSPEVAGVLCADLERFVAEQDDALRERGFSTFVASFTGPTTADEMQFEQLLWRQLQLLHDCDAPRHGWDPSVSSDPEDAHFEFSVAGRAFFVVGLHPGASRWTRRFAFPTLVFNAQFQFEELRQTGKYGRIQEAVRTRDRELQGDINPNLADFGDRSDARQYSGRPVGEEWRCPFHAKNGGGR